MAETQHVYTALGKILKDMSVEKGGQLPSNMGGKPYITAVDLSSEAKRQFVSNDLILLPSERIVKHEIVQSGNRNAVVIGIEGSYTIASTKDGSSVTVGGAGDGLAIGTAVASNIASTNALKNALLRTFLVTEQSVEDQAKAGIGDAPAEAPKAVGQQKSVSSLVEEIKAVIANPESGYSASDINALGLEKSGGDTKWKTHAKHLEATIKAVKAGERA